MIRPFIAITRLTVAVGILSQLTAPADAQTFTRQDVPRGEVTGLEMAIEGNLTAIPGGRLRWFVTVYEIVRGRDLRPAARTELRALASFHRQAPVAVVVTDKRGRASLEFEVPESLTGSFNLVVDARSPRRVKREFDVSVSLGPRFATELFVDRTEVPPGGSVQVWGRVLDRARNRPVGNHQVRVQARRDRGLVGDAHELRTDEKGLFHARLSAPTSPSTMRVEATAKRASTVHQTVHSKVADVPELLVYAQPERAVTRPGTTVQVDIAVRTPDGRPVPGATLTGLSIPTTDEDQETDEDERIAPTQTDSKGRARVPWKIRSTDDIAEVSGEISALREGIGVGRAKVRIRAARVPYVASWSVEGGALIPGLPGRVFVQVFQPDGSPWAGLSVRLDSARVTAPAGTTDKDGVAMFDATVARFKARPGSDSSRDDQAVCHGPTVAAATLRIGQRDQALCLPVDPDATVRVRTSPTAIAGQPLEVELSPAAGVARAPIAVTLLVAQGTSAWLPLAQVVAEGQGSRRVSLNVPSEARGPLYIRARPLIGGALSEVRGGTTMAWAAPRHGFGVRVAPSADGPMAVSLAGAAKNQRTTGFVMALPVARGQALLEKLRAMGGERPPAGAGQLQWRGFLAARTPADTSVAAVLRGGALVTLAMPQDAVERGLLRDPWRSRSRFVRGRLGRLFFALEKHVAEKLPHNVRDVAVRGARGWRFNSEILNALGNELGLPAVAGLDGSPLTIAALQGLDRNFVYDNVARRLTRERLLRLLVGLRKFVHAEELDYEWARRGDPRTWLNALEGWSDDDGEFDIERGHMYDGWGRPFAIRKARGARARFRFLEPIVGYEVLSAGPDGRFGTGDDMYDPFARVLPDGSLYGEAVGEQALLARLRGVELGRATIAALSDAFDARAPTWETSSVTADRQSWRSPGRVVRMSDPLVAQTATPPMTVPASFQKLPAAGASVELPLSAQPRRYTVLVGAYGTDGVAAFAAEPLRAGAPLLVDATMPPRLRPNEPLRIPVHLIGIGKRQELSVQARGDGVIEASVLGDTQFSLSAGESRTVQLRVGARRVGKGRIRVVVTTRNGSLIREFARDLSAMWDGSLRAQHNGALAAPRAALELRPPGDARPVRAFLTVSAARDVLRDPGFVALQSRYPALLGWAYALRGEPMPKTLVAELDRRAIDRPGRRAKGASSEPQDALHRACAAVAWSALPTTDASSRKRPQARRAVRQLHSVSAPSSLRERSALLVALATNAPMLGTGKSDSDPVTELVRGLRQDGWHAPHTERGRPTVMARLAAGLLLADARDVPGRELFKLARATLTSSPRGGKLLVGDNNRAMDGWVGTVALAIAARQLGEEALVAELARGIAPRLYLATEGSVEAAFWLLAASVYGVFGVDAPESVRVAINGSEQRLELKAGVGVLALPRGAVRVTIESEKPVLARLEARYVRPVKRSSKAGLHAEIAGDVGHTGDTAALEVTVSNTSGASIAQPIVEIVLPSAAELPASAVRSIASTSGVRRVETPDAMGLLRIHLAPLERGRERRLPLPVRWVGAGKVEGLSVAVYDGDRPWRLSTTPSRTIELKPRPQENWK